MAETAWLIDSSAYWRLQRRQAKAQDLWNRRISRGLVRLPSIIRMELGYSLRSGADSELFFHTPPESLMPVEYLTPAMEDRAHEVHMLLANRGARDAASIPDLYVAAMAEKARLTILEVDKDFALIAEVTGQPLERLELTT